jgi:hypothetical protein
MPKAQMTAAERHRLANREYQRRRRERVRAERPPPPPSSDPNLVYKRVWQRARRLGLSNPAAHARAAMQEARDA